MILTGQALEDFKYSYNMSNFNELDKYLQMSRIEEFLNKNRIYLIANPITGTKNGYDSFPIVGWRHDVLISSKVDNNSYYLGYPFGEFYTMDDLEKGETLEDINIDLSTTISESKEKALKYGVELYNRVRQ